MERAMFNDVQMHILQMFSYSPNPQEVNELKEVLDTNCLIAALPSRSAYHKIWDDFVGGKYTLCVSNEILAEYEEIIAQKTNSVFANNVIKTNSIVIQTGIIK